MKRITLIMIIMALALSASAAKKKKTAPKVDHAATLVKAQQAIDEYMFDDALDILADYGGDDEAEADRLTAIARNGSTMMESVAQIVVIDSIVVPREHFFEAYRLSPAAGTLSPADMGLSPVYTTQNGLMRLRTVDPGDGNTSIASERVLADGSVDSPRIFPNDEEITSSAFPFLMPDGLTLYFAAKGTDSLGGYDIYMTRRASLDDDFLKPRNLGMPYNSPADDYLLAIDEATGLGWWATDRSHIEGMVTIYVFLPTVMRNNYPHATENLPALAALRSIADTNTAGTEIPDIESMLSRTASTAADVNAEQFRFALPGGRIITSLSQLGSNRSRELMDDYMSLQSRLAAVKEQLSGLRAQYASGNRSVADDILRLEKDMETLRSKIIMTSNEIVRAETSR